MSTVKISKDNGLELRIESAFLLLFISLRRTAGGLSCKESLIRARACSSWYRSLSCTQVLGKKAIFQPYQTHEKVIGENGNKVASFGLGTEAEYMLITNTTSKSVLTS